MGRTFYLAANSIQYIDDTRDKAAQLLALGYEWATGADGGSGDWTRALAAPRDQWPVLAMRDLDAVRAASIFVLLAYPPSLGGMAELGARLGFCRRAHVVLGRGGGREAHFFFDHPLVTTHRTWPAFLDWLRDHAERETRA